MDLKRRKRQKVDTTAKKETENLCGVRKHECSVAKTERLTAGLVLELPIPILYDILSRLPMETIFSCRCVCKTFLNIVTDPYFAKQHHSTAPRVDHSLIIQHEVFSHISLAYISDLEKPIGFSSRNFDHKNDTNTPPWRNLNVLPAALQSERPFNVFLVGSCNGLLCLLYHQDRRAIFYICNPILGEFMFLPHHRDDEHHFGAFGFCPKTAQYKVIRFYHLTSGCEIHTLGTNDWKIIENAPSPYNDSTFDSSLNGNLHWITDSTSSLSNLICYLNLETEQIRYISPPSHINRDTIRRINGIRVAALDGLFCIYYLFDDILLEVCVMKEYGVESSWTKELTINLGFDFLQPPIYIVPRALLNNGDLLVCYNVNNLVYYSFRKGIYKELSSYPDLCILYAPSLISLKDIAGNQDVEVMRKDYPVWSLWLDEEVRRLKLAVFTKMYNTRTYPRIPWRSVAQQVATRTPTQCKSKWQCMRKLGLV